MPVMDGGFRLSGCVKGGMANTTFFVNTLYYIGDIVYYRRSALKGKLLQVSIKKINLINQFDYNYQDKDNRLWIENELCTRAEADQLIADYKQRLYNRTVLESRNCRSTIK